MNVYFIQIDVRPRVGQFPENPANFCALMLFMLNDNRQASYCERGNYDDNNFLIHILQYGCPGEILQADNEMLRAW